VEPNVPGWQHHRDKLADGNAACACVRPSSAAKWARAMGSISLPAAPTANKPALITDLYSTSPAAQPNSSTAIRRIDAASVICRLLA
jgi:hypothetical protein